MYSLDQLRAGLDHPNAALRELNRLYWTRLGNREYNTDGDSFLEEDWDNLLILDGCRYDALRAVLPDYDVPGSLESRTSPGSATAEFLRGTVDGRDLTDTVYVTGSTIFYQQSVWREDIDAEFHDVLDVWSDSIDYGDDGVPPGPVAERAREAAERYPRKRLFVHFVQPHAPYLGERGRELFPDYRPNPLADKFLGRIDVPEQALRYVYRENLELVLDEVEDLLDDLPGKTVLTADHGMLLGEREFPIPIKSYGHPERVYTEEMVRVPWFVADYDERKEVVAERSGRAYHRKQTEEVDEQAREHLKQMGYL
ncbi:hypothetical protein NGM10_15330 [Halorussus salilacus]|uniref:hypothetical protein n=1 Tax=Halorussus salilacus TaxID=2953750 RepID=UPI0020A0A413|nr:hypothetical protein [Halorussus salilacus]USZ68090.1 hypothetical protein NGM10_15330 [Halorussus salilacus]